MHFNKFHYILIFAFVIFLGVPAQKVWAATGCTGNYSYHDWGCRIPDPNSPGGCLQYGCDTSGVSHTTGCLEGSNGICDVSGGVQCVWQNNCSQAPPPSPTPCPPGNPSCPTPTPPGGQAPGCGCDCYNGAGGDQSLCYWDGTSCNFSPAGCGGGGGGPTASCSICASNTDAFKDAGAPNGTAPNYDDPYQQCLTNTVPEYTTGGNRPKSYLIAVQGNEVRTVDVYVKDLNGILGYLRGLIPPSIWCFPNGNCTYSYGLTWDGRYQPSVSGSDTFDASDPNNKGYLKSTATCSFLPQTAVSTNGVRQEKNGGVFLCQLHVGYNTQSSAGVTSPKFYSANLFANINGKNRFTEAGQCWGSFGVAVLPGAAPPSPSAAPGNGVPWWQVVNGDAISGGNLVSHVPSGQSGSGSGSITYNDNDSSIVYTPSANFVSAPQPGAVNDDEHDSVAGTNRSDIYFTFRGTSVKVVYATGPTYGTLTATMDNVAVASISENSAATQLQQSTTYNVRDGIHVLKLEHNKPARGSTDGPIANLDAFVVSTSSGGGAATFFSLPGLAGGFPGVAIYNGNYDFTSDPASQGTPSNEGWLAQSILTGRTFDYPYFVSLIPTATVFNKASGTLNGSDLAGGGSVSPDNYFWYQSAGSLTVNGDATINATRKDIVFVDGDLTLKGNITIGNPGQGFVAFLVSGNIIVDPSVKTLNGVYLANGTFSTGSSANQLAVKGSVAALGGANLQRDLGPATNATTPAEVFQFDPALIFTYPKSLLPLKVTWREVAP